MAESRWRNPRSTRLTLASRSGTQAHVLRSPTEPLSAQLRLETGRDATRSPRSTAPLVLWTSAPPTPRAVVWLRNRVFTTFAIGCYQRRSTASILYDLESGDT